MGVIRPCGPPLLGCFFALLLAACGSAHTAHEDAALAPAECASAETSTLGEVAARVYRASGSGVVVGQAVHRVENSTALASAVRAGDSAATGRALRELLLGQIVRIQVTRGGRVLASAGGGPAMAPVSGQIPGTSARFTLSVQSDESFLQVTRQVTGAQVLLLAGSRRIDGTLSGLAPSGLTSSPAATTIGGVSYEALALPATAYPSGALQIALLVPSAGLTCRGSAAQARVEALGTVGERIYKEELESATTRSILRRIEGTASFTSAVASRNKAALRAAIISFFAAHIHVVRVRVTIGGKLFYDLGGPHVLAPVHGVLRSGGRVVGNFEMAIQDDAGYEKLARLFTDAQVLMRTSVGQVEGSLSPGPASVPDRGPVQYAGKSYEAYSFTGEAFPSGSLRISLLLAGS